MSRLNHQSTMLTKPRNFQGPKKHPKSHVQRKGSVSRPCGMWSDVLEHQVKPQQSQDQGTNLYKFDCLQCSAFKQPHLFGHGSVSKVSWPSVQFCCSHPEVQSNASPLRVPTPLRLSLLFQKSRRVRSLDSPRSQHHPKLFAPRTCEHRSQTSPPERTTTSSFGVESVQLIETFFLIKKNDRPPSNKKATRDVLNDEQTHFWNLFQLTSMLFYKYFLAHY